jgi:hypothetical protein
VAQTLVWFSNAIFDPLPCKTHNRNPYMIYVNVKKEGKEKKVTCVEKGEKDEMKKRILEATR